jgi:2-methylcitrate dehydratase PrpD
VGAAEQLLADTVHGSWDADALTLARIAIADTLAIGIAGMAEEQVDMARSTVLASEHPLAVAVWEGTDRYAPADAAFVLGVAAHSLDWDDYMHPMHGHCSSVLLPVVWALGGTGTSDELLDAYLAGYQVNYLAGQALGHSHYRRGWHATSSAGTLGAAAAAARMLRLTPSQTAHALGLAASFAGGLRVNFGTSTKAIHAGAAARHGVQAAQLAQAGVTASPDWLLGEHGMVDVFGGDRTGAEALDAIRAADAHHGITTGWGLVQKPYCCCGSCHAAAEAVITLVTEHDIAPDDIAVLRVKVDPIIVAIMQVDEPWDQYSARYSPTWAMAAAAVDRAAGPQQFAVSALERSDIRLVRSRVVIEPDLETGDDDRFAGLAQIELVDGRMLQHEIRHALGHPRRPMSAAQRASKQAQALDGVSVESLPTLARELLGLD